MARLVRSALALLGAAAALAAGCGSEDPVLEGGSRPTILQDDPLLLFRPPAEVDRTMARLQALGVDWVRLNAGWSLIAPNAGSPRRPRFDARDPHAYPPQAWAPLDTAVRAARRHGLAAAIDIAFWAPRWAVSRPARPVERQRFGIDPDEYAQFAEAVARRYSGDFEDLPDAAAFTIWNEPNYAVFWTPQWSRAGRRFSVASAHDYRALVYAAHPAIERAAPQSRVLIGATSPSGSARPRSVADSVPPLRFLREMACVNDDLEPIRTGSCARFRPLPGDGWAHHPYSPRTPPGRRDPDPDDVPIGELRRMSAALERLHTKGRTEESLGLWITEYGYETNPPDPVQPVSLYQQARWLGEAERLAAADPRVRSFAQFLLRDISPRPGVRGPERWGDYQSGLLLPDGTPKPALHAFANTLVVHLARDRKSIELWGHLRADSGARRYRVTTLRADGTWRILGAFAERRKTDEAGYFDVRQDINPDSPVPADPGATFRLEVLDGGRWRPAGLPLYGATTP